MNRCKLYRTAAIFFISNLYLTRILASCMAFFISFPWAYSNCEKFKLQNSKHKPSANEVVWQPLM